jgi:hypothetical protein
MSAKIRLTDGREITVALSGKRTAEALQKSVSDNLQFTQFNTAAKSKVWISPVHVAAIEDRTDQD